MKLLNACLLTLFIIACGQPALSQTKKPQSRSKSTSTKSTTPKSYPNAKTQANQLNDAVLSGDYEKAADLTYPKLVQLIGGRARYLEVLKNGMNQMQSGGFQLMSTVAGDAKDVIEVGAEVYAMVPTTMKIKVPEGTLIGESALIGVSKDRGAHWTFVDLGNGLDEQRLKILFPAVAGRLKVPEPKQPVLQQGP